MDFTEIIIMSDSSSSDDDDLYLITVRKRPRIVKIKKDKFSLISNYNLDDFKAHFKIQRQDAEELSLQISKKYYQPYTNKSQVLNHHKAILVTLWTLSSQESFRSIAKRFEIPEIIAQNVFIRVSKFIHDLAKKYVSWPNSTQAEEKIKGFDSLQARRGSGIIPNVIGCLGCIRLPVASIDKEESCSSILLQATCDANMLFTYVNAGLPGNMSNECAWKKSLLYAKCKNAEDFISSDYHLVGDSTYSLETFMMVPYRTTKTLSCAQLKYNLAINTTCNVITKAFKILRSTFKRLNSLDHNYKDYFKFIIITICILHNMNLRSSPELSNLLLSDVQREYLSNEDSTEPTFNVFAYNKRENICKLF